MAESIGICKNHLALKSLLINKMIGNNVRLTMLRANTGKGTF